MQRILVEDHDGKEHALDAVEGRQVMQIIRESGLAMKAVCGGCCACATCHVYVDDGWAQHLDPPANEELDMLDFVPVTKENSRLACQIRYSPALAGLKLSLAPD